MSENMDQQEVLVSRASRVADRVQIREVILVRSALNRTPDVNLRDEGFNISLAVPAYGVGKDGDRLLLTVSLDFTLRGRKGEDPDTGPQLDIDATFVLIYTLDTFEGLEQPDLEAFSQLNGLFNAWPFWREYVRSTSSRMSLGSITIPVHRVHSVTLEGAKTLV